jgi:hypothetical protein
MQWSKNLGHYVLEYQPFNPTVLYRRPPTIKIIELWGIQLAQVTHNEYRFLILFIVAIANYCAIKIYYSLLRRFYIQLSLSAANAGSTKIK